VLDISKKMFGFSPQEIALQQRDNMERMGIKIGLEQEHTKLLDDYYRSVRTDDSNAEDKILDKIDSFNDKYPDRSISAKDLRESVKRRDKEESYAERGLVLPKKLRDVLGAD